MAALLQIDELNTYYKDYFSKMEVTEEQRDERERLAETIDDAFLALFAFILLMLGLGDEELDEYFLVEFIVTRYEDALRNFGIDPDTDIDIKNRVRDISEDVVDSTIRRIRENPDKRDDVLSTRRAADISANESNSVLNITEFKAAIASGKTQKMWLSQRDLRVRHTHQTVDGDILPIGELFTVGDSLLMFPTDTSHGADPSETVNCRCSLRFY